MGARSTLFDRFAVALLSGVLALLSGSLLWSVVAIWSIGLPPFAFVLWFAGVMAGLGFALRENLIVNVLSWLWRLLFQLL